MSSRYSHKECRRYGVKLCQSSKCPLSRRNHPPGVHGPKGRKRITEYGMQLAEKQKAKITYNMAEKQFRLTFNRATKMVGDLGHNLIVLLERRLDNVVYRLNLADTRSQARQLVNHGHFLVNGKKNNIPSYSVKSGDVISLHKRAVENKYFKIRFDGLKIDNVPGWLYSDVKKKEAKVLHDPKEVNLEKIFDTQAIIEYYSRR